MASDVEKIPRGTRVFKTQVPPFSFRSDCSSYSSSPVLSHLPLHFFIPNHFICFSDCFAFLDMLLQISVLLLQILPSVLASNLVLRFFFIFVDTSIELEFDKLEFHVDKLLQLSTKTRVFETRVCH